MIKRFRYDFKSGIVADGKGDFISYAEYEVLRQQLVAVTEQRDALVVEAAALKAGQLFFMYSDETGFEIHKTQDAAIASAKDMIAVCREEAAQDGWPEDADTICWGVIMQKAIEIDFEEPSEKNGWIGWSEYKLNPELETPATVAAIAALRAEGVEMAISHLIEKFKGTGIGVPVMALEHLARQLRESKGEVQP
jgi:hypothetical protein